MLTGLSIRDFVLIDRLEVDFRPGLCVLTGETGAGKSILLDALGLALGNRADASLVRPGAPRAVVAVEFRIPDGHPVLERLAARDVEAGDALVLRRVQSAEGPSRAYINDQPVGVALLREIGGALVEIQGQSEQRGLLDPATHRRALDRFGGLDERLEAVATAWRDWRTAAADHAAAARELDRSRTDEAFLADAVAELAALDPRPGEEEDLARDREVLMHGEKVVEALNVAFEWTGGPEGAEDRLRKAQRALERVAGKAGGRLDGILQTLDRAVAETAEAGAALQALGADMDLDPRRLEEVEERLFALRDLARKHRVAVDELPALRERLAARLAAIENRDAELARLAAAEAEARAAYEAAAEALSEARREAARALDAAVTAELPPLRLDRARFLTRVEPQDPGDWGPHGRDRVWFEVATNPGVPAGPLQRIASGGELSRFMLALKVVLSRGDGAPTIVFDEVDSGIGGATAAAVGERLARLAEDFQVLVVTHSPQVAARARHHWRVVKIEEAGATVTRVEELREGAEREELARMLSGAEITDEARAAADRLIAGGTG